MGLMAKLAPGYAVKREIAKMQYQALTLTQSENRTETRWRGASRVLRHMVSWLPTLGSGRSDLPRTERETLYSRSYDAYRNHMIARAAITRPRTNIVGTGLIAHAAIDARALGISDEQAEELDEVIDAQFATWADSPSECDAEATLDFYGQQSLALVSSMLAGDTFALTPFYEMPRGLWGLKLQLVDAARVSNPNRMPDTSTLIDGVEMDPLGRPIRYHVQNRHPADRTIDMPIDRWTPIQVFDAIGRRRAFHIWNDKDRINAVRGAPFLAPILEPLQTLETYSRAELVAAVVSALFTVFVKKDKEATDELGNPLATFTSGAVTQNGQAVEPQQLELGTGAIVDLAPGETIETADPGRPNSKYDPFFLSIVKQIGASLEIPLDELMLHYQASYSAARAAMLQAWRWYSMRRWALVQQFCAPARALWFDEAVARGRIPVTGYADPIRRAAYQQAMWVGPSRGSMDEQKEAAAARERIGIGISNETIETAAMMGENWRVVHRTRVRERRIMKRDSIKNGNGQAVLPAPGEEGNGGEA
jgi:lambda family phage portal protein